MKVSSGGRIGEWWVLQNAECIILATLCGPYLEQYEHLVQTNEKEE